MIPPTTAKADLVLSTNVGSFVQRASSALRQQLLQMMDTKLGRAWRVEYTPGKHSWTEKCVLQKNRPLLGAKNGDSYASVLIHRTPILLWAGLLSSVSPISSEGAGFCLNLGVAKISV